MNQVDFAKGWRLLLLQPWGKRYANLTDQGQPTEEARLQLEFYFSKLSWADPQAWWKVANLFAQGKEWPSVNELRTALENINIQFVKAIGLDRRGDPMPEEVREIFERMGVKLRPPEGTA